MVVQAGPDLNRFQQSIHPSVRVLSLEPTSKPLEDNGGSSQTGRKGRHCAVKCAVNCSGKHDSHELQWYVATAPPLLANVAKLRSLRLLGDYEKQILAL